ncbi:unnamed protein product [Chrysoparadoxa australica]
MRKQGLTPNEKSYELAIHACSKAGEWEIAMRLLQEMPGLGLTPKESTYNSTMAACSKRGKWQLAYQVLQQMKGRGISPTHFSYSPVLTACGRGRAPKKIVDKLLAESEQVGEGPSKGRQVISYNSAMFAFSQLHAWDSARNLFMRMRERNVPLTLISYNSAIAACARPGDWEGALALLKEIPDKGLLPDLVTYNTVIDACARGGQQEKVEDVFQLMRKMGMRPNLKSYSSAMHGFRLGGDYRKAQDHFDHMLKDGYSPDHTVYNGLIDAYAVAGKYEKCVQMLDEMEPTWGMVPDDATCSIVTKACASAGQWEEVLSLYERCFKSGYVKHWSKRWFGVMDVHDFSAPMAAAAVLHVIKQMQGNPCSDTVLVGHRHDPSTDLIIVTGIGSLVLKDSLLTAFGSGVLRADTVKGNPGRLALYSRDLLRWQEGLPKDVPVGYAALLSSIAGMPTGT